MKHISFIVLSVMTTVLLLTACSYKELDDAVHEAVNNPAETVQNIFNDDQKTDSEKAEEAEKAQIPHPEEGNHAQVGGTLTTTEDHHYPNLQYTLHSVKVYNRFEETGLDPEETVDPSWIDKYGQECKVVMADFTVKNVGDMPMSPDLVREKAIFLDMRLYSDLTENDGFNYMSEPLYFSAHDDTYKKYYSMRVSQPGDTLDFQVAFYCKKEYVEQTDTCIALLSKYELEKSLYFDIFGSSEDEYTSRSELETSNSGSESSEIEWIQEENHYLVGETVSISMGENQPEVECMVIGMTSYEGGYIEAGVQEYAEMNRPEIVDYQDQACIDVSFLVRSINGEDFDPESLLEKLQIMILGNSENEITYSAAFMIGREKGDIRPNGYKCYRGMFLCPKEIKNSPFLCLRLEGNDKTSEVFFDINVDVPGFDPDQYDTRFLDK